jgi:AcrR family transcriptional regulator
MARNKEETKARILAAVGKLLAQSGFRDIGINAVAREAGIDKVLIYRYFDGLPSLLRVFAYETHYWPSLTELIGNEVQPTEEDSLEAWMVKLLINLLHELQKRPITQEIMRWELLERNELTEELAKVRGETAIAALDFLQQKYDFGPDTDVPAVSAILTAGLIYLVLRSRTTDTFMEVNLQTPEGWQRIEAAIALIVRKTVDNSSDRHSS